MPRNYQLKCLEDPELINSINGCYKKKPDVRPFAPTGRPATKFVSNKKPDVVKPFSQSLPFSPLPTSTHPLPLNNSQLHSNNLSNELNARQKNNIKTDKNDAVMNTRFTFFTEELRQEHLNMVRTFAEHPNMRPIDKTAALFANAAYMEDFEVLDEYLNKITTLGEEGWTVSPEPKAHNKWFKTFINEKTGDVFVSSKGTVEWFKEDGLANIFNTTGGTQARQTINDRLNVDIRTNKARVQDSTYRFVRDTYGDRIVGASGHSQAGYDAAYFQENFAPNAEVITFNSAPKGVVPTSRGTNWTTTNDVVSLTGKIKAIVNPLQYKVNTVRSIDNSLVNRFTGGHMSSNFVMEFERPDSVHLPEAEITETTPLISNTNLPKPKNVVATSIKNIGRGIGVGLAGAAADAVVESIAPDQPVIAKTAEKSVLGAGAMRFAANALGAPSATAPELVIPLFTSYVAAEKTTEAVDEALKDTNLSNSAKAGISGAAGGGAGGVVFGATSVATVKATQAAKAGGQAGIRAIQAARAARATASATEIAAETELVPLLTDGAATVAETAEVAATAAEVGEGLAVAAEVGEAGVAAAELGGLAAVEAGLITTTEVAGVAAGAEFGLNPVADGIFIAAGLGAAIGGVAGIIGGFFTQDDREREKEAQILENARKKEWKVQEKIRYDKAVADYDEKQRLAAIKKNESVWLGQHKYGGATTYQEAFDEFKAQQDALEAERQEAENQPFVLQQGAS